MDDLTYFGAASHGFEGGKKYPQSGTRGSVNKEQSGIHVTETVPDKSSSFECFIFSYSGGVSKRDGKAG